MKNVGRIQVASPKKGDGKATSVVVTTPFASAARAAGRGRRTVETSGASASVPSRDSMGGTRGRLDAGVVAVGDRQWTKGEKRKTRR